MNEPKIRKHDCLSMVIAIKTNQRKIIDIFTITGNTTTIRRGNFFEIFNCSQLVFKKKRIWTKYQSLFTRKYDANK